MDQALSQLYPINRIGSDGFNWWVGQVEGTASDDPNNKGGTRYKVRIVGEHPQSKELLDTPDLPWCNVMMPVNVPFMPGNEGGGSSQLAAGCWVVGFYLDPERQKPIIMGSIGQTPGATTIVKNRRPDDLPFTTSIPSTVNPAKDGQPAPENKEGGQSEETNKSTGGLSDGTLGKDGKPRVPIAPGPGNGDEEEKWCQAVAEKCENQDLATQIEGVLGELLAGIQKNGGNLGDYLINKYTGGLYSATEEARKYVNKILFIVNHFIAKVKGYIIGKLEAAVKDLVNMLLAPSETGNVLTPVTEFFNKLLKDLGCQMEDLGERLAEWLTNVLMDLVTQIYQAIACQIDALVNGILSKISSLIEELLSSILGPIEEILGSIGSTLDIIGGAINYVLSLLGISCSGPDQTCSEYKKICTDGSQEEGLEDDKDFLDDLLTGIDSLFPTTGADYTSYTCEDAYGGQPLTVTTIGFTGGVPKPIGGTPGTSTDPEEKKILYSINDIIVEEGKPATFIVTRSGYTSVASSLNYRTLNDQGTAIANSDYYPVDDILGFQPGDTSKSFTINTFYDQEKEKNEDFYVELEINSPSKIPSEFIKNIGKCTITEQEITEDDDSKIKPKPINPFDNYDDIFPEDVVGAPTLPKDYKTGGNPTQKNSTVTPTYTVSADKSSVKEGEFVTFSISTTNVKNGSVAFYTITGVDQSDIIGSGLTGSFTINNSSAQVTIGIEEDDAPEITETLVFTINGTGASTSVLVVPTDKTSGGGELKDFDKGKGETTQTTYIEFQLPTVDPKKVITDDNGGIIQIPVENPGSPWAEPPYVFINGNGIGATAVALLDEKGYLTEIRVKSSGYNYQKNLAVDKGVRCIIDTFTLIRPGINYSNVPDLYINGELGIAEALINEKGFVIGARILDRTRTFDKFPKIEIVGGGGYGAKLLPSLVCLDTPGLVKAESTKIGTGRYVDCP